MRALAFALALVVGGSAHAAQCVLDAAVHERLDQAATGGMKSFRARGEPFDVSAYAFVDADGASRTLADWRGRTVLFNLWATWCAPCRAEMPHLDELKREMSGDTFDVVTVSIDATADTRPRKMFADLGLTALAFFHDRPGVTFRDLRSRALARGLPITLVVDPKGCAIGSLAGPADWAGPDARKLMQTAIEVTK